MIFSFPHYMSNSCPSCLVFTERSHRPPTLRPRVHPPARVFLSVQRQPDCDQQRQGSSRSVSRLLLRASRRALLHVNANIPGTHWKKQDTSSGLRVLIWQRDHTGAACFLGDVTEDLTDKMDIKGGVGQMLRGLVHEKCTDVDSHVTTPLALLFCLNHLKL